VPSKAGDITLGDRVLHGCFDSTVARHAVPDAAHHAIRDSGLWDRRDHIHDARGGSVVEYDSISRRRRSIQTPHKTSVAITMTAAIRVSMLDEEKRYEAR
jgi:hypothetical protein